jgi:hypothetical protein
VRIPQLKRIPVRIEWKNPADDWPTFWLIGKVDNQIVLQGRDDGKHKHDGDIFTVTKDDFVSMKED